MRKNPLFLSAEVPEDLQCLLLVADRLNRTFDDKKMQFWKDVEPFHQWNTLVELLLANRRTLLASGGAHLVPAPPDPLIKTPRTDRNPMYSRIDLYSLYAMLCADQENPDFRPDFGALQLQVLDARWRDAKRVAEEEGLNPLVILDPASPDDRKVRVTLALGKAVRNLSLRNFTTPASRP